MWCQKDGNKGIDIRGIYDEDLTIRLANGGKTAPVDDISPDHLRATITAKDYPPDLDKRLRELANWIVDNHERFAGAKPSSKRNHEEFLKNYVEPQT